MATSKIILIGEDKFKELSGVVGNFDYEYITPFIIIAQDLKATDLIGERFMSELQEDTLDCCIGGDNERFLEKYLQPFLVHEALSLGLNQMVFKAENSGLVKRDTDNGTSAELNESSFLADQEGTIADAYGRKMRVYLEANADLYPAFKQEFLGETSPQNTPSFSGGLYVGNGVVRALDNNDRPTPPRVLPTADFYCTDPTAVLGESVSFMNTSSENSTGYSWAFGDGNFSAVKNPTHVYSTTGIFTVTLQVSNSIGTDVKTIQNYVTIIDNP
jgi:hypothetical protein